MAVVLTLRTCFPSSIWRRRFTEALIELDPRVGPGLADNLSEDAYRAWGREDARIAAHRYVVQAPDFWWLPLELEHDDSGRDDQDQA